MGDVDLTSLRSIDLFAGAGGLSEGLREAGFSAVYASEINPTYAGTFSANHPSCRVDARDIRDVDPRAVRRQLDIGPGDLDLIAGGPPCQGFSINAPRRTERDRRNHLFREFLRFVEEFEPRAVLIENVPGLVSYKSGGTLAAILESLANLGYAADVRILYAPHFGVPQARWRTIILGLRDHPSPARALPDPTHWAPARVNFTASFEDRKLVALPPRAGLHRSTTIRDAIGDLPPLRSGESGLAVKEYRFPPQNWYQSLLRQNAPGVLNHEAPRLSRINLERLRHIPPGGNWTDIPRELLPEGMKRARPSDHTKRYGRADPDGLSSTILTKCDPHWGAYFHYDQDRSFTVREAARLQSFPDRYDFRGSRVAQYEQVGNAVPPLLAKAVGESLARVLEGRRNSSARDVHHDSRVLRLPLSRSESRSG